MKKKDLLIYFMSLSLLLVISTGTATAGEKYVAGVDEDGIQKVEMVGGSYFFRPDHVVVRRGIPVQLKVVKDSLIVPHNIVIEKIQDGKDISEALTREEQVIDFTPSEIGIYNFYCDKKLLFLKSHRDKGMKGIIEVVD